jgi:hypothetical protein
MISSKRGKQKMTKTNLEKLKESLNNEIITVHGLKGEVYTTIISRHDKHTKYLDLAISDKITQLKNDLKYLPGLFFELPGVASERDKGDKIDSLQHLQSRIKNKHHKFDFLNIDPDVLDGETLELFKYAIQVHPHQFNDLERRTIEKLNPEPRLSRHSCFQ